MRAQAAWAAILALNIVMTIMTPIETMLHSVLIGFGIADNKNLICVFDSVNRSVFKHIVVFDPSPNKERFGSCNHSFDILNWHHQIGGSCGTLWGNESNGVFATVSKIGEIKTIGQLPVKCLYIQVKCHCFGWSIARILEFNQKVPRRDFGAGRSYPGLFNFIDEHERALRIDQSLPCYVSGCFGCISRILGGFGTEYCSIGGYFDGVVDFGHFIQLIFEDNKGEEGSNSSKDKSANSSPLTKAAFLVIGFLLLFVFNKLLAEVVKWNGYGSMMSLVLSILCGFGIVYCFIYRILDFTFP